MKIKYFIIVGIFITLSINSKIYPYDSKKEYYCVVFENGGLELVVQNPVAKLSIKGLSKEALQKRLKNKMRDYDGLYYKVLKDKNATIIYGYSLLTNKLQYSYKANEKEWKIYSKRIDGNIFIECKREYENKNADTLIAREKCSNDIVKLYKWKKSNSNFYYLETKI